MPERRRVSPIIDRRGADSMRWHALRTDAKLGAFSRPGKDMAKLGAFWVRVRESLWFLPGLFTLLAVLLALGTVALDELMVEGVADRPWLFGGGPEAALSVLGSIATSLITVTGVTFSVTIVALQLASSQYTPRVLRNFTGDRSTQLVLGVFIATFTYALLIQRRIRIGEEGIDAFVPAISVTIALFAVIVSIGFLIYFIDHLARSIQASMIIQRATEDARTLIDRQFPEALGERTHIDSSWTSDEIPGEVRAYRAGYLQAVDELAIARLAGSQGLTVGMEVRIGDFVLPDAVIASVWPSSGVSEEAVRRIRRAFVLGPERTLQQDVVHALAELVDIAVRALSPSVNDPETAKSCIDRLGEVLALFGQREFPPRLRTDDDDRVYMIARQISYEEAVTTAFGPLRHFGADNPDVAIRLVETCKRVMRVLPRHRRGAVLAERDRIVAMARRTLGPEETEALMHAAGMSSHPGE